MKNYVSFQKTSFYPDFKKMPFVSECDLQLKIFLEMSFYTRINPRNCDFGLESQFPQNVIYVRINPGNSSRMWFTSECDLQRNVIYIRINPGNCSRMSFASECDLQQNIICIKMWLQMWFCPRTPNLLSLISQSLESWSWKLWSQKAFEIEWFWLYFCNNWCKSTWWLNGCHGCHSKVVSLILTF